MARNNGIKGITIAINGDTQGLSDSLKDVNKETKKVQSELKDVEKALQLDPSNTALVAQKMDLLADAVSGTSTKLDALRAAQSQVEAQFASGDIGEEQYRAFQRELSNTEAQLRSYQSQMQTVQSEQERFANNQRDLQTYLNATGQSVDDLANTLGARLTGAIRDGSASADQLDQALNRIGRSAGNTGQNLQEFRSTLRNVDAGSNLNEVRQDLERIGQAANVAEQDVKSMGDGMKSALSGLATAGGVAAINGLVDGMTEANQALGMLEVQANNAGVAVDSIGQGKVALSAVNHDANQIAETMGNLMQAGYDNADAINQISEALAGAKVKYGETFSGEGLAESITTTTQLGEVTGQLTDLLEKEGVNVDDFNAKMQSLSSTQERANYISQLLANQGLNSMYQEYAALNPELVKNAEATTKNESAMAELATALTPLATMFTNTATSVVEWANENEGLAIGLASVGIGLGAVTTAFATLTPAISAVVPLLSSGGLAAGGLGAAFAAMTGPIGLTVAAVAGVGIAVGATAHQLSQSSIEIEGWKDSVSESTAEAVGSFMDLSENATLSLNQLAWSGQVVTAEMASNLVNTYDQMGQQILTEMQSDHAAQLQSMTDHFAMSQALTETEEVEILAAMQTKNAEKELAHQESQARIAEILNLAKEEKRAITEAEQLEINAIQQTMTDNAIQYLTENEREQKVIYENLKNEASKITADQAAEVVKNSLDQKEKVVAEAQDQYDKTVAEIIKQRDEMGTISAEQAQKLIEEAKIQRDGVVDNAKSMHSNVVTEAQNQANEHVNKVDWETGQVKSKWEVLKTNVGTTMSNLGTDIGNKWDSALSATKSKAENIKNEASQKFEEMKTKISTSVESAKDAVGDAIDKIKGFFAGLSLKLPDIKMPKLPRFKLTGKFSLDPPSVPKIGIDYFAKGGLMTKPTVFGMNGNNLMVGGEASKEAILPLTASVLAGIGKGIAAQMQPQQQVNMPQYIVVQSVLDGEIVAQHVTPFVSQNQYIDNANMSRMKGVSI